MVQEFRDPQLPKGEQSPESVDPDDDPIDVIRPPLKIHRPPQPEDDDITEIRKQVSIFMPISDWKLIRMEAAQRHIAMTALVREWMEPHLKQLRNQPDKAA